MSWSTNRPHLAGFIIFGLVLCTPSSRAGELGIDSSVQNQARFEDGLRFLNTGNCLSAASTFEQLYADTQSQRVKLEWARALHCLGNYDQSERLFHEVLDTRPPYAVRARVGQYLDEMERATGKLDYQLGIARDTNPRAVPTNATINILGTPLTYTPQFDTSPQFGLSYRLVASKALDDRNTTVGSIGLYGIDYAARDFDINNYEVALTQRMLEEPRLQGRLAVERRYYAGEHLYDYTSLAVSHMLQGGDGGYWKNELKVGTLDYTVYDYLDGVLGSYTTSVGRNFAAGLGMGVEFYMDRYTAIQTPYSYKTQALAWLANFQFTNGAVLQGRLSASYTNYDSADPFFGVTRSDQKSAVLFSLSKPDFDVRGFTPIAEVGYEETQSTISFYSFSKMTLNLAFRKTY